MQNRYAGDVGDFSKFGLLRQLAAAGLTVGINWYLVDDEGHNHDGKHIGFLADGQYDGCDDSLREALRAVVEKERKVLALEAQELIRHAVYFSEPLRPPVTAGFSRDAWHRRAMNRLYGCDLVFLDPDNGILTRSISPRSVKSIKYVLRKEICEYYAAGHSVIVYNHRCREPEPVYLQRFDWMREETRLASACFFGLKFKRGSVRDYLFVVRPAHLAPIVAAKNTLMDSPWNRHFRTLRWGDP